MSLSSLDCSLRIDPSQTVIFLYLVDNETSWLVIISVGLGVLIEYWKITKAVVVNVSGMRFLFLQLWSLNWLSLYALGLLIAST